MWPLQQSLSPLWTPPEVAAAASYDSIVLADGPLGYWPMQETSGTAATDATGGGHTGTYNGGFTLNQSGPATGVASVSFNGTSGYLIMPSVGLSLSGGVMSVEIWGNVPASSILFEEWSNDDFLFLLSNGPSTYGLWSNGSDRQINYVASTGWHHFVETMNSSGVLTLYVDGTSVATASTNAFATPGRHDTVNMVVATHGTPPGTGALTAFYSGNYCRAAVYGSCLSSTQVAAHYAAGH